MNNMKNGAGSVFSENAERIVTDSVFQKKDPARRSIFLDGEYAFSMSPETFRLFPIEINQKLTVKQIEIILSHEEFEKAKTLVLQYLSVRMRSEHEILLYLKKKGLSEISIRRTIAYCKEFGYINDREYAATFTRDMLRLNRYGIQKIRFQLVKRGISKDIIDDILENQITEAEQYQIALGLAQKKADLIRDKNRPKEKLYSYLRQRGFKYSIIQRVLKEVL